MIHCSCIERAFFIIKFRVTALKKESKFKMHEEKQSNSASNAWWYFFLLMFFLLLHISHCKRPDLALQENIT